MHILQNSQNVCDMILVALERDGQLAYLALSSFSRLFLLFSANYGQFCALLAISFHFP